MVVSDLLSLTAARVPSEWNALWTNGKETSKLPVVPYINKMMNFGLEMAKIVTVFVLSTENFSFSWLWSSLHQRSENANHPNFPTRSEVTQIWTCTPKFWCFLSPNVGQKLPILVGLTRTYIKANIFGSKRVINKRKKISKIWQTLADTQIKLTACKAYSV